MKKVCFAVCLLVAMAAMIACAPAEDVQLGSQESDLASSEHIEVIATPEILDGESNDDNDSNQDSENIMPLPKNTEELFGFNAEVLLLGKTFKEIKEACHDLVYTGSFQTAACFYSESKDIWWEFGYNEIYDVSSDIKDYNIPDNEEENSFLVAADAKIIFPDMGTQLSTSDIEAVIGTEVDVMNNDAGTELEGEYVAIFRYKGYHFLYLPEEIVGDIFLDTIFHVSKDD